MRKLVRLTALIAALLLVSGVPAYAHGGGGGGHGGGGGRAFGGPHGGIGGHGFDGHHGFGGHRFEGHHGFHGRGFVGIGPSFYWGSDWDPFWPYGSYGSYAYTPSPVMVQPPPVYIEKPPAGYWYYCPSVRAYYPNVQSCAEPWMPVAPRTG